MKSRNIRFTTALVTFGLFVALAGLIAPTALGATASSSVPHATARCEGGRNDHARHDSERRHRVRQGELVDAVTMAPVTNSARRSGSCSMLRDRLRRPAGVLHVIPQPVTVNGVADVRRGHSDSIDTENEPQFTELPADPHHDEGPVDQPDSRRAAFDVWEDGESCTGGADTCQANLRGGNDTYTLSAAGTLGASELTSGASRPRLPGTERRSSRTRSSPTRRPDRTHRCSSRTTSRRRTGGRRRTTGRPMPTGASGCWTPGQPSAGQRCRRTPMASGGRSVCRPRAQVPEREPFRIRTVHREPERATGRAAASRWDGSRPETRPAEPDLLTDDLRKRYARPFQGRA